MDEPELIKKMYASKKGLHQIQANLIYNLEVFGDYIASAKDIRSTMASTLFIIT